jgi:type IV secretory pathway VirJ component
VGLLERTNPKGLLAGVGGARETTLALFLAACFALFPALPAGAADLPKGTLVELRGSAAGNHDLALIISGDGGWADLDKQLGTLLAARGTSVLGFDAMKYFWETRSPDDTARDVSAALATTLKTWDKQRLILIGYSFGGAVMPFVLSRLPEELRRKVTLVVLLSTATYANWEIHWGDWLHDQPHQGARPVLPELARVEGLRLLCVYGAEESADSLCPTLPAGKAELLKLPGGHHFDENYPALAEQILRRLP